MRAAALALLLPVYTLAQSPSVGKSNSQISQLSIGNCSPNIQSSGSGSITVQILGSCGAVDPVVLSRLTLSVQKFLGQFPKTIGNLNELLDKKNLELADKAREVDDWIRKYNELSQQLAQQPSGDELSKKAADALHSGNLVHAEGLLRDLLGKEEKQLDLTSEHHFNLAEILELRLKPSEALLQYEIAFKYRPDNPRFGYAYARLLHDQDRDAEAQSVLEHVVQIQRRVMKTNPQANIASLGHTLNTLGIVDEHAGRQRDAETAYKEALQIYRDRAKSNPQELLYVAYTLNNLGELYEGTKRFGEANDAYAEALQIFRNLVKTRSTEMRLQGLAVTLNSQASLDYRTGNLKESSDAFSEAIQIFRGLAEKSPSEYLPHVASVLINLGDVYGDEMRLKAASEGHPELIKQADDAYADALRIYRGLAKADPQNYQPTLAETLDDLGSFYRRISRLKEAADSWEEELRIYRDLAQAKPQDYLPELARALSNIALLYSDTDRIEEGARASSERMKVAVDADLEALQLYRDLAKSDPQTYLPDLADTHFDLGGLFRKTQRMKEAADAYTQALPIYRDLVKIEPEKYLPDLAATLSSAGFLYEFERRHSEAVPLCAEAAAIYKQLSAQNPAKYASNYDGVCTR